ncbi:protein phosphatase 1 regulatory subunit 42 isoform X2 [Cryptotermes secundus]|uniref:protein phosphatase 1 regulatory subunit 42 isoform X2 n=1 Tax=Cryptotermes secundus TaxID=105785 RepID=UPI000CD7BD8E|nr:protein phosphatase 1 regulatory subunit 42 isoform X2 [Cryptotermes secundus]
MVKLTSTLVTRKTRKKSRPENDTDILRKLTHLHLQGNFIDTIGDISQCKNLTVIYLQNNCLTKIENLEHATQLTHLYLQRNKISKIENLNGLKNLKKLYLGHNCIAVIEGLDKLYNLEELHVQRQQLPQGETLHFDPRTMKGLARCLHTLDVTSNGMTSVADLECLNELKWLIAQNNCLCDIMDLTRVVSQWNNITSLELEGNPVCSQQKYRERLITCSNKLALLDGKQISDATRDFLKRLEINKAGHKLVSNQTHVNSTLPADITSLTKNFTPGVTNSITRSSVQDAKLKELSCDYTTKLSKCFMFPAWKAYKL